MPKLQELLTYHISDPQPLKTGSCRDADMGNSK